VPASRRYQVELLTTSGVFLEEVVVTEADAEDTDCVAVGT